MPSHSIIFHVLSSVLLATMVLSVSPRGHSEERERAPWVGETFDGTKCISVGNRIRFGPFDYLKRAQFPDELQVVEWAHFTSNVERLESGETSYAINDIAYTIAAWPNHPRALASAMRYRMAAWEWPEDAEVPPAECQLQRAIAFSPNDPVPYMMFGTLLHKAHKYDDALKSYQIANRLRPDDVLTLYNMGLTLVELKQYEEAVQAAKKAYAAGFPLPGLKNKLIAVGQWPGADKPVKATAAAPNVQVQEPSDEAAKKASAEKVMQKGQPNPKGETKPKPEAKPTPEGKPKPEAKPKPKGNTTANNKDQSKETAPLATGDKQGVKTPEVTQ